MQKSDRDIKTTMTTLKRKPILWKKLILFDTLGVVKFAIKETTNRLFVNPVSDNLMEDPSICLL